MNSDFSRTITFLRKERKITQKQAAKELGISQALLSHYEKGIRECGLDFIVKAADYYNVSCDYLLGRSAAREMNLSETAHEYESQKQTAAQIVNRRQMAGILNVIYDYVASAKNRKLDRSVTNYLMLSLYKLFRQLYSANPDNSRDIFSIPDEQYGGYSDSAMMKFYSDIRSLTENGNESYLKTLAELNTSQDMITKEYPESAGEVFNVIRLAENTLSKLKL